ncbi:MAG: hypothetical protein UV64_C0004G0015 [Parcubacteria group bacterium GW2011_GWC1_43_11b]|nr:MAG: hypothetical protein UV50_C0009G0022 [Parcubacteria group bacterium GW2011_GWB1_42_9]KKS89547.1 MAG: hypothetical protein UV64_C0004G0015 [Parcubacteria group bacterium GW2011_GWC1_43_11b]KKT09866.1 MAG: hypothetical protein UV88_C0004G0017 [Parcubacteria group bacterium GW2011_GWA1_43_21]
MDSGFVAGDLKGTGSNKRSLRTEPGSRVLYILRVTEAKYLVTRDQILPPPPDLQL